MAKKFSHTHLLKRHRYPSGNAVFFCTLPECHYKIDVPLALGKLSLCNICRAEFIMNEYTLKLAKPHCPDCGKVKVKDASGHSRYAKKVTNKILSNIASVSSGDLKSRLASATNEIMEDDI